MTSLPTKASIVVWLVLNGETQSKRKNPSTLMDIFNLSKETEMTQVARNEDLGVVV